jgi:antitoxin HicB
MYLLWYSFKMSSKSVIARQMAETMEAKSISRQEMAKRMATSRAQIARLFDPKNDRVQLDTIQRAAAVLGMRVNITLEDVGPIELGPRRGRHLGPTANTLYTMWLCHFMATTLTGDNVLKAEFLSQHKQKPKLRKGISGGYVTIGEKLRMEASAVEGYVRKARERLDTKEGQREYHEWQEQRENQWWFHHAEHIEKQELKLPMYVPKTEGDIPIRSVVTRKQVDSYVTEAQKRLNELSGEPDYQDWLALYERRNERLKATPHGTMPLPEDHPEAMAIDKTRKAKGLRLGLTKRGAPRGSRSGAGRNGRV